MEKTVRRAITILMGVGLGAVGGRFASPEVIEAVTTIALVLLAPLYVKERKNP